RLGDGWLPSFCTPDDVAAGRIIVEDAAVAAGRTIDPEHFGALVFYARTGVPPRLLQLLSSRRPDLAPNDVIPVGHQAVLDAIGRFIEAGFSKFVLVPAEPVRSWDDELGALADVVLPLQRGVAA